LSRAFVASMSAVLAEAGCMASAEPNPMYSDPVYDGTARWGESLSSVVQNDGCRPTPARNCSPRSRRVHRTDRAPMQ
jgi:hypothetical protein